MRARRLTASLLALTLLGGAACGDDGGDDGLTSEEQAYADAWARSLTEEEDGFSVSEEDADCMAAALMAEVGAGPFEEAGVEPADIGDGEQGEDDDDSPGELLGAGVISDAQADAILDEWEGCTDLGATLAAAVVGEFDLDEEAEACVADGLREDDLAREGLKPSFTSDDDEPPSEVLTAMVELIDDCAGGEGGDGSSVMVDGIASSLAADGTLTEEEAQCVAREMVDVIGLERLMELGAGGDLDDADPAVQQEIARAVLGAAEACDIPLSALGG